MKDLVLHRAPAPQLVALARSQVDDGSIRHLETPSILRRVASAKLDQKIVLGVVVVTASPVHVLPPDDFALVEFEARPGVLSYRLVRVPTNRSWQIRVGVFERTIHRACALLARQVLRALRDRIVLTPTSSFRLPADGPDRPALSPGPSAW